MFKQLNADEKVALTGILKWVVSADHNDSLEGMDHFFKENKWGDFKDLYMQVDQKFSTIEELKSFLKTIDNKEAQQIIAQIAKDVMLSDVMITSEEKMILQFLEETWGITLE